MGAITTTLAQYEATDVAMHAQGLPMVKVAVLNPHTADFTTFGSQLNKQEIDFDDMRPTAASATLLSIQVRYLYEMRVPFANWMIQSIWFAAQVGALGLWTGPNMLDPRVGTANGASALGPPATAGTLNDGMPGGLDVAKLAARPGGKFYMPVNAWYTMRMQSNPYLKWAAP